MFRNNEEGVQSELAAVLREVEGFEEDLLVVEANAALRSIDDDERKSSDDLLALGRGVRCGVSFKEEAILSEDLLRRLCTFGVFLADMIISVFTSIRICLL